MDVYTARSQLEKILKYVEDLAATSPRMYAKSRERWRDIADLSTQLVHGISTLIQEEIIEDGSVGFESTGLNLDRIITSIEKELTTLKQFSHSPQPRPSVKLAPADCKKMLVTYHDALQKCAGGTYPEGLKHWAELMAKWLDTRFYVRGHEDEFKYNIVNFPSWIAAFVLAFGYAWEHRQFKALSTKTGEWINEVNEGRNNYPIPKSVVSFVNSEQPTHYTLTAAVVWDMLYDAGLSDVMLGLSDLPTSCLVQSDTIYNLCNKYNPDCLDYYTQYTVHPEIVARVQLERRCQNE